MIYFILKVQGIKEVNLKDTAKLQTPSTVNIEHILTHSHSNVHMQPSPAVYMAKLP
jgi:hypothetical protein